MRARVYRTRREPNLYVYAGEKDVIGCELSRCTRDREKCYRSCTGKLKDSCGEVKKLFAKYSLNFSASLGFRLLIFPMKIIIDRINIENDASFVIAVKLRACATLKNRVATLLSPETIIYFIFK